MEFRKLRLPESISDGAPSVIRQLPAVSRKTLWHVGDIRSWKQVNGDFEGPLLSVSTCPDAWERIARLGGRQRWEISKANSFQLVDARKSEALADKPHMEWARLNSLVVAVEGWEAVIQHEDGASGVTFHETKEEAEWSDESGNGPRRVEMMSFSPRLLEFWNQRKGRKSPAPSPFLTETAVLCLLVEASAHKSPNSPDGLWWNDRLEPSVYSAPRGCLVTCREFSLKSTQQEGREKSSILSLGRGVSSKVPARSGRMAGRCSEK